MRRLLGWLSRSRLLAALSLVAGLSTSPINADVIINEVLASNRETNVDQFQSSSDWVELLNTGSDAFDLTGYWLSDDPQFPQKWQVPVLTLAPGEHRIVWCSGEDHAFPDAAFIEAHDSETNFTAFPVTTEAEWSYLTDAPGAAEPPNDWFQPEFDDSSWANGKPPFGFGDFHPPAVPAELRTATPPDNQVVLLRARFNVDDPSRVRTLVWRAYYDDGFVAYLNGVRVLEVGYSGPDPTFDASGTAPHNPRNSSNFDMSAHRELLRAGENVVAVALLNASGDDVFLHPELGEVEAMLHTNFQLDSEGEGVFLSNSAGDSVDAVVFPQQAADRSYGRSPDGGGTFFFMLRPTPGATNAGPISTRFLPNNIVFSPESGVFDDPVSVSLSTSLPFDAAEIRFTTDGQAPEVQSAAYDQPIPIAEDTSIRAAGFVGSERVTRIVTKTFFVSELARELELPILSITMTPDHFFDVHVRGGTGIRSERPAHMQIFDAHDMPVAAAGFGMRLHGGAGRAGEIDIKKAYRAYFRGIYGDTRLNYPIIPDTDVSSFDKLVLRSNFNDAFRASENATLIRDQVIRDLHEKMGGVVSHGSWYNVFVNGEYRGLYNIVKRMDQKFFESYFPTAGENWDVIKTGNNVLDGDNDVWREMIAFMQRGGLSDDGRYNRALDFIDVDEITSYMIVNIWAQNHDWPHNNWYAARPQGELGRWFFSSWDAEFGIGLSPRGHTADSFSRVVGQQQQRESPAAIIFGALLRNRGYQEFFLEAFDLYLTGVLSRENVLAHIDRLAGLIEADLPEEAKVTGGSVRSWELSLSQMREFAAERNRVLRNYVLGSRVFSVPVLLSVSPKNIVVFGPTDVTVNSRNVTEPAQVFFNEIPAVKVVVEDAGNLRVTAPFDLRLEGTPTLRLESDNGEFTGSNLLTVSFPHAKISAVDPQAGFPTGGDVVRITGKNLTASARVEFGGRAAPRCDSSAVVRRSWLSPPREKDWSTCASSTPSRRISSRSAP